MMIVKITNDDYNNYFAFSDIIKMSFVNTPERPPKSSTICGFS